MINNDYLERIAIALERIADSLEQEQFFEEDEPKRTSAEIKEYVNLKYGKDTTNE